MKLKLLSCSRKSQSLGQLILHHTHKSYSSKIIFILLPYLRQCLPWKFHFHACCISCPFTAPRFSQPENIRWKVKNYKVYYNVIPLIHCPISFIFPFLGQNILPFNSCSAHSVTDQVWNLCKKKRERERDPQGSNINAKTRSVFYQQT